MKKPSWQSRLFVFALRNRHLLRFQLKRTCSIDWGTSIPDLRLEVEKGPRIFGKLPPGIETTAVDIDGITTEWVAPTGATKDQAILYFHGGGYVVGSSKMHRRIVAKFVKGSSIPALVFDYRLAPEHPFPAALDDSVVAYRWLLAHGVSPSKIAFIGDSGGGGLCLATLLALKDKGIPLPAAAVAMSPWTDLTNSGDSWRTKAEVDTLCWQKAQIVFSKYYAGDHDPSLPLISPLFGDLSGLPPTLLYVGGDELLLDDSTRFARKAEEAGVDVTLHIGEGMFHCYPVCAPLFPEAREAMADICAFIKKHLGEG